MSDPGLSVNLLNFISTNISSVSQLEILLFLFREKNQAFTSKMIASALHVSENPTKYWLGKLCTLGFLKVSSQTYKYDPANPDLAAMTELLAREYQQRRLRVIDAIVSGLDNKMMDFKDAFKFGSKKEDDSNG